MLCVNTQTRRSLSVLVRYKSSMTKIYCFPLVFVSVVVKYYHILLQFHFLVFQQTYWNFFSFSSLKMGTSFAFRNLKLEVVNNAAIQMFLHSWNMSVIVRYMVHPLMEDACLPLLTTFCSLLFNYALLQIVAFSHSPWFELSSWN